MLGCFHLTTLVTVGFVDLTADDEVDSWVKSESMDTEQAPLAEPSSSGYQELLLAIDQYNEQQSPSKLPALSESSTLENETESSEASSERSTDSPALEIESSSSISTSNIPKKRRGRRSSILHDDVIPGEFFCDMCKRNFRSARGLKQHTNAHHSGVKAHCCDICGKRFDLLEEMKKHRERHSSKNKPFGCRYDGCSKRFMHEFDMDRHMTVSHGKAPCVCEICGKGFARQDHLEKHHLSHKLNTVRKESRVNVVIPGDFFCDKCKRNFRSARGLTQHTNSHHNGVKAHSCDICGKRFDLLEEMKEHRERHSSENKPFGCKFDGCLKRFMHECDMDRHMAVSHGQAPCICEICRKGFGRQDHLKKHQTCHKLNTVKN